MFKLDLTKEELQILKDKVILSEMQERILEYRLKDYTITKMARLEYCSESTINKQIRKIKEKIKKVL